MSIVEDDLRLAWQAARDGRPGVRDALLTLAVAECPPGTPWFDRAWKRLVTGRSDHLFSRFANRERALADAEVAARLKRLRATFHPLRVRRLLDRAEVLRGPYTGRSPALAVIVDELVGRRPGADALPSTTPQPARPSLGLAAPKVALAPGHEAEGESQDLAHFYLTVLLAIAILLATTTQASDKGSRAA